MFEPLSVFSAGLVSSVGPCVAPRFVAVAACATRSSQPRLVLATFLAGLIGAYASFGFAATLLAGAFVHSSLVYAAVASALFAGGCVTIARCRHRHGEVAVGGPGLGGIFLLGASFAFVVSPCCTPLVIAILEFASGLGRPLYGAMLLALFALGHAAPLVLCGGAAAHAAAMLRRVALSQAASIVSGGLMLGLAGYYALLV
jgi:cytochrome c-type biogenesis protein